MRCTNDGRKWQVARNNGVSQWTHRTTGYYEKTLSRYAARAEETLIKFFWPNQPAERLTQVWLM